MGARAHMHNQPIMFTYPMKAMLGITKAMVAVCSAQRLLGVIQATGPQILLS